MSFSRSSLVYWILLSLALLSAECDNEGIAPPDGTDGDGEMEETVVLPNIVLIVADDLGLTDLSVYGNDFIETPRLQQLADAGVVFNRAYCASPICSPSRAAIQTGWHPARIGMTEHIRGIRPPDRCWPLAPPNSAQGLALGHTTLAELLKDRGYRTAFVGKWHLGGANFKPALQGYDVSYAAGPQGLPSSFHRPYFNGRPYPELFDLAPDDNYLTDALTTLAIRTLPTDTSQRFFLNLNYYSPHVPIDGPDDLVAKYEARVGNDPDFLPRPEYAAMVEAIDRQVGRLIDELSNRDLLENTLILFTSDHGPLTVEEIPAFAAHTPPTTADPYREGKGYIYEGGLRVPLIAHQPRRLPPGQSEEIVSLTDLWSTFSALSGRAIDSPDGRPMATLTGEMPAADRRLYFHYPHYSPQGGSPAGAIVSRGEKFVEWYSPTDSLYLFNLDSDPGEQSPQTDGDRLLELKKELDDWRERILAKEMTVNPNYDPDGC